MAPVLSSLPVLVPLPAHAIMPGAPRPAVVMSAAEKMVTSPRPSFCAWMPPAITPAVLIAPPVARTVTAAALFLLLTQPMMPRARCPPFALTMSAAEEISTEPVPRCSPTRATRLPTSK